MERQRISTPFNVGSSPAVGTRATAATFVLLIQLRSSLNEEAQN